MIDFAITEEEQLFEETAARFGEEHLSGETERDHEKAREYPDALHRTFAEMGLAGINRADSGLNAAHRMAVWTALAGADTSAPFGLDPIGPGAVALDSIPDGSGFVLVAPGVTVENGKATGTIPWVPRSTLDWLVLIRDEGLFMVKNPQCETLGPRPCGLQAAGGLCVTLDSSDCEQVGDAVLHGAGA